MSTAYHRLKDVKMTYKKNSVVIAIIFIFFAVVAKLLVCHAYLYDQILILAYIEKQKKTKI